MKPIKTFGLTHIALKVKSIKRSLKFYQHVFGMEVMYNQDGFLQMQTPGCHDIVVFEEGDSKKGNTGGIAHFGFRLQNANDIEEAAKAIMEAGGLILSRGEFVSGEPYIFFKDPDGYEVEVWYELPG
jgi:catechol 2,3-dioxygenase-like lactoylglutathione lyase family enzyme